MSAAVAERPLRIGEVARLVGTTPRTVRYYEEIGLLPAGPARTAGQHRLYGPEDVHRLRELLRLKELLGVTLEELRQLVEAEEARAALRDEWGRTESDRRRGEILVESLGHLSRQLELVRRRQRELDRLERELTAKRRRVRGKLRRLRERVAAERS
jgi:DNA-binding transcriptional MerR regulator